MMLVVEFGPQPLPIDDLDRIVIVEAPVRPVVVSMRAAPVTSIAPPCKKPAISHHRPIAGEDEGERRFSARSDA